MNIAAVEKVPFVLVASNNHFAYSTPNDREFACANLVDRAQAYGYEGHKLDGTDLAACLDVIGGAVERARAGGPPQLVVASLLRLSGHGEHDDASYVPAEMKKEPWAQDCVRGHGEVDPRKRTGSTPRRSRNGARKFPPKWRKRSRPRSAKRRRSGAKKIGARCRRAEWWTNPRGMTKSEFECRNPKESE